MKAIELAAGESSRFYPYNSLGHKSLVTLLGKPLIIHTLENLKKSGIETVIIIEGKEKNVSKTIKDTIPSGMNVSFVVQDAPVGMGEALLLCKDLITDPSFFLMSAYHFDFPEFANELEKAGKNDVVLLTQKVQDASQFGLLTHKDGKVVVFEKPQKVTEGDKIVGIYLLTKKFIETLKREKKEHYSFESAISTYAKENTIVIVETKKPTIGLKFPWDLLDVKDYLLENIPLRISKSAKISSKAIMSGNVFIDEGATVMEGAVITGPAYIGKNAYVGTGAIIRNGACIEANAVVGGLMEIKNSILMERATTHSGFIGDSVVGENTKIAAGFNTANVRLDKNDVKVTVKGEKINTHKKYFGTILGSHVSLGIRVGTMPGVIIGNNTVIGPGTTVMENVEDNVTYYTEFKKTLQKKKDVSGS
ncbi:MAG: sugar phosphate nucleotidyltransferase [Candidatus Levyibacteriota bacterium]